MEPGEDRAMNLKRSFYAIVGFLTVGRRVLTRKTRAALHRS